MPNPRLNLLVRKNAGRRLLPVLKKKLASALNVLPSTVNFLPLEESDQIREQALCAFPPRYDLEPEADTVGVVHLSTALINKRWQALLEANPDGFILVDPTFSNQVVVDVDRDDTGREIAIVAVWGADWGNANRKPLDMNKVAARELALGYVKAKESAGLEFVLLDDATIEEEFGWVFFYDSKRHVESGDYRDVVVGNAPIVITRADGCIHETGTAFPVEHYLEKFRRLRPTRVPAP